MAARDAYARGQAAFASGDYEDALRAFNQAYEILPNPVVLRSIAAAEEKLGRVADAIAHLSAFLKAVPHDPERAQVARDLEELRQRPGELLLRVSPSQADIFVDDRPASLRGAESLELSPGTHRLSVSKDGFATSTRDVRILPGGQQTFEVRLAPLPDPVDVSPSPYVLKPQDNTTALWIAGGVCAAGVAAGSVFGLMALAENADYDDQPSEGAADRGERLALFADVSFGVAAMAFVTGTVLYLTREEGDPRDRDGDGIVRLRFGVTPLAGGALAGAGAQF